MNPSGLALIRRSGSVLFLLTVNSVLRAMPSFTIEPEIAPGGNECVITFSVSQSTDVEVAVIDTQQTIVRHLAAGKLGGGFPPPYPLSNSTGQSIRWDYRDDNGRRVGPEGRLRIRVRLGLNPQWHFSIATQPLPGTESNTPYAPLPAETVVRESHPVFSRILAESNPKLFLAVNDVNERVYIRPLNSTVGSMLVQYEFDGRTGRLLDTLFRGQSELHQHHRNGEIAFTWDGKALFSSSGLDCLYRFNTQRLTAWPVSGITSLCGLPTEYGMTRGHAAGPDNCLYNIYEPSVYRSPFFNNIYADWQFGCVAKIDSTGNFLDSGFIRVDAPLSCVRLDPRGNIFVGARVKPLGQPVPGEIEALIPPADTQGTLRYWAEDMYGSVLKFRPTGGGLFRDSGVSSGRVLEAGKDLDTLNIKRYTLRSEGLEWFRYGFSPALTHYGHIKATGDGSISHPNPRLARLGSRCLCQIGRFDVDRFGRVFIPDPYRLRITAVDNSNNILFSYGHKEMWAQYDSLIRKGTVRLLAWPHAVEATDEALYIADQFNNQVVRFKLEAEVTRFLDVPISLERGMPDPSGMKLRNDPNPFNSVTRIQYRLSPSERASVFSVYDQRGRCVRQYPLKGINGSLVFYGKDPAGRALSSGIYIGRLESMTGRSREIKILLLR